MPIQFGQAKRYKVIKMKILNSLKAALKRDKNNKLVRRKGRVLIINKTNPRYKARQGKPTKK